MNETGFENMDTDVYWDAAVKYLPATIKYLFVAESPPAFKGASPKAYLYFENVARADSLFYTLMKAIYDIDFEKHRDSRIEMLTRFSDDGYFLIDAVEHPINKTKIGVDVKNKEREIIIRKNRLLFENRIHELIAKKHINKNTKCILIKETVYNQYLKCNLLNIINKSMITFPSCAKDKVVIRKVQELIS